MDAAILTSLVATVLSSGALAGFVTHRLNAKRDDRLFLQQRLEELHEAFFAVSTRLGAYWMPFLWAMANKVTYNQALDMVNSDSNKERLPIERLQMLASLYHPKLLPLVDDLLTIREEANGLIHVHKEEYRKGGPHATDALRQMRRLSTRLAQLERDFMDQLRALSVR